MNPVVPIIADGTGVMMGISKENAAKAPLDWCFKAWPANVPAYMPDTLADLGWSILNEDVMLPVAVLSESAMRHNSAWMRRFTELADVKLAPHGKTTMSPELFDLQFADGAWGMTAATAAQVRIYRAHGINRIILANQLVGRQPTDYVLGELRGDPDFDFYCLVDSVAAIEQLERRMSAYPLAPKVQVLLELGLDGGRGGVRDDDEAMAVALRASVSHHLSLRGIEAFEGILQGGGSEGEARMCGLLQRMVDIAERCRRNGLFSGRPILSAGGSSFFDVAAAVLHQAGERGAYEVILRSGCYLVHDSSFYAELVERLIARSPSAASLGEGLRPALEVWAYVQSRPEPTRAIIGLGKRDTSADVRDPTPVRWARPGEGKPLLLDAGHRTVRLDDHHAYVDVPADSPLQVGDMVAFGVSHPCTTFDRWPALFVVDDALTITGAVRTFF